MVNSATLPFPTPTKIAQAESELGNMTGCEVATEVAALINRAGADSIIGMVLRRVQNELQSLSNPPIIAMPTATSGASKVVGPVRIRRKAA